MKKILTILIISLMFVSAKAQTDEEYRMEIGAGVGMVAYEGDFNGSVLSNMQFGGSVVLRRVFNPYMGLKMSAMYGKLTGASKDVKTYYPDFVNNPYSFSNTPSHHSGRIQPLPYQALTQHLSFLNQV